MASPQKTLDFDAIKAHLESELIGTKNDLTVGLELEIWPFRHGEQDRGEPVPYYTNEDTGLIQVLRRVSERATWLDWSPAADGNPMFKTESGGNITFEPGGQLEYSSPPHADLESVVTDMSNTVEQLRCCLKCEDIWFFHSGLTPWHEPEDVGLQQRKERYLHMDAYFNNISIYGQRMMRLSTSLQVNLDTGNPETAKRRWLAANLMSPIFTAIFANSPFSGGKPAKAKSFRTILWRNLDPSRTGFPLKFLQEPYENCIMMQYLQFAMNAYVLMLPDSEGRMVYEGYYRTFKHWMLNGHNGLYPDMDDWKQHLTTLFPEVRPKGFFEVRCLDAQSRAWCTVPAILFTQLLYSESAREKVIELLMPYRTTLEGLLREAAISALENPDLGLLADQVYRLALDEAPQGDAKGEVYKIAERFYQRYTQQRRTPADELLSLNDGEIFSVKQYLDFEASQLEEVSDLIGIIQTKC